MVNPGRRKNKTSDADSEPELAVPNKKHKSRNKPAVAAETTGTSSDLQIHSKSFERKLNRLPKVTRLTKLYWILLKANQALCTRKNKPGHLKSHLLDII